MAYHGILVSECKFSREFLARKENGKPELVVGPHGVIGDLRQEKPFGRHLFAFFRFPVPRKRLKNLHVQRDGIPGKREMQVAAF